jgi:hypothetical protein
VLLYMLFVPLIPAETILHEYKYTSIRGGSSNVISRWFVLNMSVGCSPKIFHRQSRRLLEHAVKAAGACRRDRSVRGELGLMTHRHKEVLGSPQTQRYMYMPGELNRFHSSS